MFPLLFQDSLSHPLLWIDQSEVTMLTSSVPTKSIQEAFLATLSGEWVISVAEICFPGKEFKKLLKNHQQLNGLTHCDVP